MQIVIGGCEARLFFEYTHSPQLKGGSPFFVEDFPKPCALSLRHGRDLERFTFETYYCKEILALLESPPVEAPRFAFPDGDLFACQPLIHGGVIAATHPDSRFKDGAWRPAVRDAAAVPGLKTCHVNITDRVLVCPALTGAARDWMQEVMAKLHWRVRARSVLEASALKTRKLAPGDRTKGHF